MSNWIRALTKELEIDEPCYRHSEVNEFKKDSGHFDFKLKIWRRINQPFYLVAVPMTLWESEEYDSNYESEERIYGVTTRKARYRNTGRIFYEAYSGPDKPFAYEYQFEAVEDECR